MKKDVATLLKKDSTQVFSCEFCEIFKNTFFYRTHLVAASGDWYFLCSYTENMKINAVQNKKTMKHIFFVSIMSSIFLIEEL